MHHLQQISELAPVLEKRGVRQVVISPGSRNAPLIHLFTSHNKFTCHSIVDERSAGYVALGMARHLGEPVVLVCTSGTAVLNLSPAVAEAFHQGITLVVLTADRPLEKLPQNNNQVIDQFAPFYNYSKGFLEFPAQLRSTEDLQRKILAVEELLAEALKAPAGPVHINLPLTEPLYVNLPKALLAPSTEPNLSQLAEEESKLPRVELNDRKILILAGMATGSEGLAQTLEELVDLGQVVVVAENISNLVSGKFISRPELVLADASEDQYRELIPDVVIAFGKHLVSKRIKLLINACEKADLMAIPEHVSLSDFLRYLAANLEKEPENLYLKKWLEMEKKASAAAAAYLETAPYSNLVAVHQVLERIPEGTHVHLGNSSTIRYSQLFPSRRGLSYYSNRGTSGIDGSLSTAVGAAMVSENLHLLMLGDLSFVYDSNGLWNKDFPSNLKIIVLNDGGGGIFRLLDGPDQMDFFEEFSVTHHPVSLELLSQSFGKSFQRVSGLEELHAQMESFFTGGSALSVLEVDTSSAENSRIFKELFS